MTSISSITQQYAKQQQQQKRETQKGGAMFEFLAPSEDEKNKSTDAVPVAPVPAADAAAPVPAPGENETLDNNTNEPSVLDKLKDTFGLGDSTPETKPNPTPVEPPVVPVEAETVSPADKIKGFFGMDTSKKEEEATAGANDVVSAGESDAVSVSDSDNAGGVERESDESDADSANEFELIAEKTKINENEAGEGPFLKRSFIEKGCFV